MCRLAVLNREAIRDLGRKNLTRYFNYLENRMGGHGNGIAMLSKTGFRFKPYGSLYAKDKHYKILIQKGNIKNKVLVRTIFENINKIDWVLYHTRLTSSGGYSEENTHPYIDNGVILAMNGTERWAETVRDKVFEETHTTDTYTILRIMTQLKGLTDAGKIMEYLVKNAHSVFIGYASGKVFVTKGYGDLEYLIDGNKIILASDIPLWIGRGHRTGNGFKWTSEDGIVDEGRAWAYGGYSGYSRWRSDDWYDDWHYGGYNTLPTTAQTEEKEKDENTTKTTEGNYKTLWDIFDSELNSYLNDWEFPVGIQMKMNEKVKIMYYTLEEDEKSGTNMQLYVEEIEPADHETITVFYEEDRSFIWATLRFKNGKLVSITKDYSSIIDFLYLWDSKKWEFEKEKKYKVLGIYSASPTEKSRWEDIDFPAYFYIRKIQYSESYYAYIVQDKRDVVAKILYEKFPLYLLLEEDGVKFVVLLKFKGYTVDFAGIA